MRISVLAAANGNAVIRYTIAGGGGGDGAERRSVPGSLRMRTVESAVRLHRTAGGAFGEGQKPPGAKGGAIYIDGKRAAEAVQAE